MVLLSLCTYGYLLDFESWWHPVFATICVSLYGLYLVCNVQSICDKSKYKLTYDDHIMGAVVLYFDIIAIIFSCLKKTAGWTDMSKLDWNHVLKTGFSRCIKWAPLNDPAILSNNHFLLVLQVNIYSFIARHANLEVVCV